MIIGKVGGDTPLTPPPLCISPQGMLEYSQQRQKESEMAKHKKVKAGENLLRAGGQGAWNVNQHAPVYAHKNTKRNKTRSAQKRHALAEQV